MQLSHSIVNFKRTTQANLYSSKLMKALSHRKLNSTSLSKIKEQITQILGIACISHPNFSLPTGTQSLNLLNILTTNSHTSSHQNNSNTRVIIWIRVITISDMEMNLMMELRCFHPWVKDPMDLPIDPILMKIRFQMWEWLKFWRVKAIQVGSPI